MRTTLTVDDELLQTLKAEALRRKRPFKEIVNETLRRGIAGANAPREPYQMPSFDLGHPPKMDLDRGLRLVDVIEDDEIQRKLHVKK